jgi:broad specificity phosphatase PhoE
MTGVDGSWGPRFHALASARKTSEGRAVSSPVTRAQAAADAIASVRAEGLDPARAEMLLAAWARGELTDRELEEVRIRLLSDHSLTVEEVLATSRAR